MKRKLSKREVLFIIIFAVVAAIYAYLYYLILPSYARIEELNAELLQKKRIAADRDVAQKNLDNMDKVLEASKAELEDMEKMIPYNVKLPELVVNIDRKLAGLGISIKSIAVGEPDSASKSYSIIPVNVSMEGNYDNINAFIKYIEDNERKFIIDSFSLAPANRSEAMPFDIAMRTFVLKDEPETVIPEPQDYYFFKHDNGKSYPFLEGGKKTYGPDNGISGDIEEMEKKYDKLDDILDKLKGNVPNIDEIGEEN